MRITTTTYACPLLRPFAVAGGSHVGVSVLSAWTLSGSPLSAADLWPRFVRAAGPEAVLDQGIPKSASEYLLVGTAHASEPTTHLAVSVEVGSHRKVLNVVGDRVWHRDVPTVPTCFTRMPLDWRHAFGGEGYADNPLGKGYVSGSAEGVPLPNVELPGHMIASPGARPTPASFAALGIERPQRTRGLGTYDQAWFENDFPGFARDVDWRVHNVASEDQRFEEALAPGLRVALHNVVEGQPLVELVLPRVRARCFTYRDEAASSLEEVPLVARTLWLVPDEDMLVLVFQGSQRISSMLASELQGVLVALDHTEHPREVDHFGRVLQARLDRELGALEMLDERPLMPEGMSFPDFEARAEDLTLPERSGAMEANLMAGAELRRQEALRLFAAAGFEGGEALFPTRPLPEPSTKPLAEQVREALETAERERVRAEALAAKMREDAERELRGIGADPSFLSRPPAGPPVLPSAQLAATQELVRNARSAGAPVEALEVQLEAPELQRQLAEKDHAMREAYRVSAHLTDAVPEMDIDRMGVVRATVEAAIRDRASLAGADLTGADLADLDLSGMDLHGAWLEGANLSATNLAHAVLDDAVLAKANLGDAIFRGTSLARANLGKARLVWTAIEACNLEQAILAGADLRGCRVSRTSLEGADLAGARFEETRFDDCDLNRVTLLEMALGDTAFRSCKLEECTFVNVDLDRAAFERCRMAKAAFVDCSGIRVVFSESVLENARFVGTCRLDGADFRRADLRKATLRGGSFAGARFDEALLAESDVSQAVLAQAVLYRADLRRVLATETDLREAVLRGANLMFAVLQGADLRGTDIRGANLHAADLALVRADTETRLEGSLVTRVRHRPLRTEAT